MDELKKLQKKAFKEFYATTDVSIKTKLDGWAHNLQNSTNYFEGYLNISKKII